MTNGKQFVTTKSADADNAAKLHARHVAEIRALIEAGDVNPQEWYDDFKAAQGRDTSLSDDDLVDVIADEDDNADDFNTSAGRVRLMLEAEARQDAGDNGNGDGGEETDTETEKVPEGTAGRSNVAKDVSITGQKIEGQKARPKDIEDRMQAIADVLNADTPQAKALREQQTAILDAPVTQKMGAVRILVAWRAMFKGSNVMPLALWPIPYSVEKPDQKNPVKCNTLPDGKVNPDIYKAWRKNDKGKMVSKQQSAYGTLVDDTEEGQSIKMKRAAIAKAKEGKHDKTKWSQMYLGWGQSALDTEDSNLQSRRTRLITTYRQARGLELMFESIKNNLPNIEARFATVPGAVKGERVIIAVMKPIVIAEKVSPDNFKTLSVTSFLSIDVDKAVADGGEYTDVLNNIGAQDTDTDAEENTKWDYDTFDETAPDFLHYLEKHQAEIRKKLSTKKVEESADSLCTLWEIQTELANILKIFGLDGTEDLKVKDGSRLDRASKMRAANLAEAKPEGEAATQ